MPLSPASRGLYPVIRQVETAKTTSVIKGYFVLELIPTLILGRGFDSLFGFSGRVGLETCRVLHLIFGRRLIWSYFDPETSLYWTTSMITGYTHTIPGVSHAFGGPLSGMF